MGEECGQSLRQSIVLDMIHVGLTVEVEQARLSSLNGMIIRLIFFFALATALVVEDGTMPASTVQYKRLNPSPPH